VTLRITRLPGSPSRAKLKLEGRVAAQWAALLEHECSGLLRSRSVVSLDLADVSFVDRAGVEALERLSRSGVEIRCRPGSVASVLEAEGVPVEREADGLNGRRS
jgi:anti-anti-sigma regulatory factor